MIFLVGARLNWMLHFGKHPRFDPNVKIIQVDITPEEMHNNLPTTVALHGDIDSVVTQVTQMTIYRWLMLGITYCNRFNLHYSVIHLSVNMI